MKFKRNYIIKIFTLLLLNNPINAQKSDVGNWFIYFGNQKINNKWNWHNEVQYRNFNFIGDVNQLLFRTGLGYNLTENNNNLLLGYSFINTQKYLPNSTIKIGTNEHRIFQQFITRKKLNRVYLLNRIRIEERFFPTDFQMRFRYFLSLNIPLNKSSMEINSFYLSAYNEIFLNGQQSLFDRNRLYGAIGYIINNNLKTEAGFMVQKLHSSNRNQFQIVVFNNIPFNNN